ncbi:periplasmic divalent cation tolerance protein [Luteibacter rhizovicinus]|uniref:Periplasmic divalent cation tolerance protein n=1 Tax=Luteibacter rhizovicinus TaxID=242606 RepID=A0A4R3YSZ7_9GAMM|nr:divalent-cation tolerance protein CutA [Luteibacter rhizovicinus]TCV96037.1 periplasmic divalent cation tolerance protein [Luteibacter rhizovicinus]
MNPNDDTERVLLAMTGCGEAAAAQVIATALVEERLAACVNIIPGIRSTYRWDDRVQTENEVVLLIKTTAGRYDAMQARLIELHPYEVPEIVAIPVERGHAAYLDWVRASTGR